MNASSDIGSESQQQSIEMLKAHRQDYLFRKHEMLQIPFVSSALEERFSAQVSCT